MGNRHGSDKNKTKEEKKKDKDAKKQKTKKKTKNRHSSTPSEQDSQAVFESLEDLSQGACAAPRRKPDSKSQTQPDVLADITFDPATRPRDHSMHGAWSSDEDSPNTTLGYSTPLLQTPKIQRSAHGTPDTKLSLREHAQEVEKSIEYRISQNLASSQGEVRLRNKSESLSPASSPGLSRDVRKKRALGQAIHENGSSKAIAAAILFAPSGSQNEKGEKLPGTKPNPEISIMGEDRDSLEDALCPWLKDDDVSIDEEQLDEMFISCIDLSYSMADACSEKEFTGGSEADFSSLESKSRIKDRKAKQKQAPSTASCYKEWEGSSVDPISSVVHNVRTPTPNQNLTSPMLKMHQTPKAEQHKSDRKPQSKINVIGTPIDRDSQASALLPIDSPSHKQTGKDSSKSKTPGKQTTHQDDNNAKENETRLVSKPHTTKKQGPKPAKKPGKSKDKKRKNSKSKIVPVSEPPCVEADSDVTIQDEHKYQGSLEKCATTADRSMGLEKIPDTAESRNMASALKDTAFEEEFLDDVILLRNTTPQCLDSTSDEPHRFMGDGQTPADFAASIMLSMSDTSRDLTAVSEAPSRNQPMSKLVQRITGFIREETVIAEESETKLHKQPVLSRDTTRAVRADVNLDTYSKVLDKVFLKNDKPNVDASFSEGYSYKTSGSNYLRDQNSLLDMETCAEVYGKKVHMDYTPDTCENSDLCLASPHLYPEEVEMYLTKSEHTVTEDRNKPSCLQQLQFEQHRTIACNDVHDVCDNIAGQITTQLTRPAVRESSNRADNKHYDDERSHILSKTTNSRLDGNQDTSPNTLSELEKQLSEASISESFTSAPLTTKMNGNPAVNPNPVEQPETRVNGTASCNIAGEPSEAVSESASVASSHVPPPSPSAMDALAELDEDVEEDEETDDKKSKEIQLFGDSVLKRLSSLMESQGNESSDENQTSPKTGQYDKQDSTNPDQDLLNKDERVSANDVGLEQMQQVPLSSECGTCVSDNLLVTQHTPLPECKENVEVSKDKTIIQSETDVKVSGSKSPVDKSQRMFENGQSVSSITSTDTDNQNKGCRGKHSSDHHDAGQLSEMNQPGESDGVDNIQQANQPVGVNDIKSGNTKRKSKSKKAKAKAKKLQAKAKKSKSAQNVSKENVNPKIIVKRPKIPDELTHLPSSSNPKSDSNSESNPDSNPVPPKRESQQITEVIDAYGDVVEQTTETNDQINPSGQHACLESDNTLTKKIHNKEDAEIGGSTESQQTCLESINKLTEEINDEEYALSIKHATGSDECKYSSARAAVSTVECQDERKELTESRLPDLLPTNHAKRPEGLPLQRIIKDCDQTYREAKASWELSDESDTTEESFENIDFPAEQSPQCESSSSADSVFRIPDISETIGEMDSVKNILDDFEDKTPQAERLPQFVGKELMRPQTELLNIHRRSRMSPALTNRTESDLDVSEMRDDISTDSMYADDEGDGTLLFSKSYIEQPSGSGVLMSCTFYNSSHNKEDSDDFWEDCGDEAYHQIEISADAATATFEDARKQMHEIHEHLRTLRLQMETLQDDLENASITPEPEFQTESDDKRLITD